MSFQGKMAMPRPAVIIAPIRKVTFWGDTLMKTCAGLTTFAAMLVESVATERASSEMTTAKPPPILPSSTVGSQIASPKMVTVAEVTATLTGYQFTCITTGLEIICF